jgi:hypothetical protein
VVSNGKETENRKNKTAENKLLETADQVPWGIVLQTDILV